MLVALLAAPFVAAVVTALGSGRDGLAATRLGLVLSLALTGMGACAVFGGYPAVDLPWFTLWGTDATVRFSLLADGTSSWLALLTLMLGPAAILGSRHALGDRMRDFCAALFALQGCLVGAFLAGDAVLFYFFFEAGLLPMLILIGLFGDATERRAAGLQFFLYTMLGSVFMLVAIWFIAAQGGSTAVADLPAAVAALEGHEAALCFWAFALAFAVKTPLLPFHSWQAPVYAACPAGGAVVLAGAMAKLGTYGFLRFVIPVFPAQSAEYAWLFMLLGVVGVVIGALLALAQTDLKRMLAFSSLSHLGLVVVGIFSFEASALDGAVVQMVAHGLAVGALFLLIGSLEGRTGRRGLDAFGGIAGRAPIYAALFVCAALAAVALPGTAAFVGEVMLLHGTFVGLAGSAGPTAAVIVTGLAGASLIFGAGYVLRAVQRLLYGRTSGQSAERVGEIAPAEGTAVAFLLVASLVLGLVPGLITGPSSAGAQALGEAARDARDARVADEAVATTTEQPRPDVAALEEAGDDR